MSESEPWKDHPAYKFFSKQAELQRLTADRTSDPGHKHRHSELARICDEIATLGYLDEPFRIVTTKRLSRLERKAKATSPAETIGYLAIIASLAVGPTVWMEHQAGMFITAFGVAAFAWCMMAKEP